MLTLDIRSRERSGARPPRPSRRRPTSSTSCGAPGRASRWPSCVGSPTTARGVVAQGSVDRDGRREDGRAACVVYAWMAAEESRRRSGRTRAGLEREGLPVGRQARATDKPRRRQWLCCPLGTGASELRRGDACRRERPHQPGRRLRFADQDPQVEATHSFRFARLSRSPVRWADAAVSCHSGWPTASSRSCGHAANSQMVGGGTGCSRGLRRGYVGVGRVRSAPGDEVRRGSVGGGGRAGGCGSCSGGAVGQSWATRESVAEPGTTAAGKRSITAAGDISGIASTGDDATNTQLK